MSLEDQMVDEGRRLFLRAGLVVPVAYVLRPLGAFCAQDAKQNGQSEELPVLKKRRITFEQVVEQLRKDPKGDKAGKYNQLKMQYLDQVLVDEFKLVVDPKRNPEGIISKWYYWQDKNPNKKQNHKELALQRMTDDLKKDGEEARTKDWITATERCLPDYHITHNIRGPPGQKLKNAYLLVDESTFKLANEDEVFSLLEGISWYGRFYEFNDAEGRSIYSTRNLSSGLPTRGLIFGVCAHSRQLECILGGKRRVTPEFTKAVTRPYLNNYLQLAKEKAEKEKTKKDLPTDASTEIYEFLKCILDAADSRLKAVGYEHRFNEKENTYELVKISEKK